MPVNFLDAAERIRLSRFPTEITSEDLKSYFTLSSQDKEQVFRHNTETNWLGFSLQLGALRYLGFCPKEPWSAPKEIIEYLAAQLKVDSALLETYGRRKSTRSLHASEAQVYLGYHEATESDLKVLADWLMSRALEHNSLTFLLGLAAEKLKNDKIVRPGLSRLSRLVASVRDKSQAQTYQLLASHFTPQRMSFLDGLLKKDEELGYTRLEWFRREARVVSPRLIQNNLKKLEYLRQHDVHLWQLTQLNPNRRKFLAQQGRHLTPYLLERMSAERRYPLLLAFVAQSYQDIMDETLDLFIDYLGETNRRAGKDLEEFRLRMAQANDRKVRHFQTLGTIALSPEIADSEVRQFIFEYLPRPQMEAEVEECEMLIRPQDNTHYDFLLNSYKMIRSFSPRFLEVFTFRSNPASAPLLTALETLKEFNRQGKKQLSNHSTLAFVPGKWMNYVLEDNGSINRYYYEMAALWELRSALRAGNVWVEGSRRFGELESYLIPRSEWVNLRPEVCQQTGTPVDGARRLKELGKELENGLGKLQDILKKTELDQAKIRIEEGKFVLSPLTANELPASVKEMKQKLRQRLPWVELVSLLIEVDHWTGFTKNFQYVGEYEPKLTKEEKLRHLYATIVSQACNLSLARMEKASGLVAEQLAYSARSYLREETLKPAITTLVNYQYHQPLSQHWGGGTLSSSDGQRFPVAVKNRKAKALPRYFGYGRGLTFYTWSSDQHSQFGSKVIVSTDRDALYLLDALMDNETELPLLEHTSDTAGFTEIVFGLFSLLGMQFSPRIRDVSEQRLYRLDRLAEFPELKPLIQGTINQALIVEQWDELLRLAGSIKLGWVTASLLIGKLQSFPQKNATARALAEYGKLIKTIFILRYYESETFRHRIEAQLNKGESLHSLREFIFYANRGQLRKHDLEEQSDQANCLTLVTNAVVVWNTVYMAAILEQLKAEGFSVSDEDLPHLSPTRFEHINVHGRYEFNVAQELGRNGLRELRKEAAIVS
ncbi:MAG: Tn3 family transposase [Chloroflexi bacterium]|mgnify:CR=1 FL=1|nr:Tn3 family transposase [Chloroflexota bacterium]